MAAGCGLQDTASSSSRGGVTVTTSRRSSRLISSWGFGSTVLGRVVEGVLFVFAPHLPFAVRRPSLLPR